MTVFFTVIAAFNIALMCITRYLWGEDGNGQWPAITFCASLLASCTPFIGTCIATLYFHDFIFFNIEL